MLVCVWIQLALIEYRMEPLSPLRSTCKKPTACWTRSWRGWTTTWRRSGSSSPASSSSPTTNCSRFSARQKASISMLESQQDKRQVSLLESLSESKGKYLFLRFPERQKASISTRESQRVKRQVSLLEIPRETKGKYLYAKVSVRPKASICTLKKLIFNCLCLSFLCWSIVSSV